MNTALKNKYIGDRGFYERTAHTAVPLALNSALQSTMSTVDTLMVSWIGMVSAVGTASQINTLSGMINYGIVGGIGMFAAQFFGAEDYRNLKKTKLELENYAMLVMKLGVTADGDWQMNYNKAVSFWRNLDSVLPEEIGSVLSPMPIEKISFERTHTGDTDTIAEAEQNLFTAAGVSSLLFNNSRASSSSLLLSIKADQAMTYSVVKSIETMLNRYIRRHTFGKYFRVSFLDTSTFNRKEFGDEMLKAATYGMPTLSYYAASQGILQDDMDALNYLEDTVLDLKSRFVPLRSSSTMSADDADSDTGSEGGRRQSDIGELTDEGENSREKEAT